MDGTQYPGEKSALNGGVANKDHVTVTKKRWGPFGRTERQHSNTSKNTPTNEIPSPRGVFCGAGL